MQPQRINTLPDPSQGLYNCGGGMSTVESPHNLTQSQVQLLRNFYPGQPAKPRNANRDIMADNTVVGSAASHSRYLPQAMAVKDTSGNICFVVIAVEWDGSKNKYVYEMWNPTANTRTKLFNGLAVENTYFGMVSTFDALYIVSSNAFTDNYYQNGAAPSGGDPLGHKIIEYYNSAWIVRDMHLSAPVMTYPVECVDAALANFEISTFQSAVVVYKSRIYVMGGYDGALSGYSNKVYASSNNGSAWVHVGSIPLGLLGSAAVVYEDKIWLSGGSVLGGSASRKVYYSTDGITWTEAGTDALPVGLFYHTMLVYNGKMWVIGGTSSVPTGRRKVYYSTNGSSWTEAGTDALTYAVFNHSSIVYNNKMWVIGGVDGSTSRHVYSSTDGVTWAESGTSAIPIAVAGHTSLDFGGKMWVIAGKASQDGTENVYYSTDGASWTEAGTNTIPFSITGHESVVYSNKMWMIGGYNSTLAAALQYRKTVYRSSDGITWTQEMGGSTLSKYVSIALTAVRRTDAASKLAAIADYTYPAWETYQGKTVVGTDELKITGTVSLSGNSTNNLTGSGTAFTTELAIGDYVRIDGYQSAYAVTAIQDNTNATVSNAALDSYTAKSCSILPAIGDPITVDTYSAGIQESLEDFEQRQIIYTSAPTTSTCRFALRLPDVVLLKNQGATHLRVWMTLVADDAVTVAGISHGFVADIALSGNGYDSNKVYFIDKTNDGTTSYMGGIIASGWILTVTGYTAPPSGCFVEYAGDRMWIAGETGNIFCSEKVGGDGSDSTGLPNKYASLWDTSKYYVRTGAPSTDKNTGVIRLNNELLIFTENRIYLLANADYLQKPQEISGSYGCAFPNTIVRANIPMMGGGCVFFVSNRGPAVVMVGGQTRLLSEFSIKELNPDDRNQGAPAAEIFHSSVGATTGWYSRRKVTAHFDHRTMTYWVKYGDSDDDTSGFSFTSFKMFGCRFDHERRVVAPLEATFATATATGKSSITFEPQVIIPKGDGTYVAFSHKKDGGSNVIYRLTEVMRQSLFQDTYINTVSGVTAYAANIVSTVSYSFDMQSGYIYIAKSREHARRVWSVPVFLNFADTDTLHISLTMDNGRLVSEADYSQQRQSGVTVTGSTTYRMKITCFPKRGLWGSFVVVRITKTIPSTGALDFHGFSVKVLPRDIPNEFIGTLGALTSTLGALTFVEEADATPEVTV